MAGKPQTAATFKNVVIRVDRVGKARKVLEPKFKELATKLAGAMQAKDGPMLELLLKGLETHVSATTAAMKEVDLALADLREVETDDDFVAARMPDLEKVMTVVSEARTAFTKQFEAAKQLDNKGEKVLAASDDAGERALRALARLDHEVDDAKKELTALFGKAEPLNTKCCEAVDAHDATALKAAQSAFKALGVEPSVFLFEGLVKRVDAFEKEDAASKDVSAEVRDELKDGVKDMRVKLAGVRVYADELGKMQERIPALEVAAIDVKKAARVLELDHQDAKIQKALAGKSATWERGLDALPKELRMKKTGKQLLQDLQRAHVL